jgi:hypothetical protein
VRRLELNLGDLEFSPWRGEYRGPHPHAAGWLDTRATIIDTVGSR